MTGLWKTAVAAAVLVVAAPLPTPDLQVERVTTAVPFPRGLVLKDGKLFALSRGRVRDQGGVSAAVNDRAGTIWEIDPNVAEPYGETVSDAVRDNARVVAEPTSPPFRLWDVTADPPWSDRFTDRPYCTLRFHEPTQSFYLCAFSGIDKAYGGFSKNLSDAVLRYDLRTDKWYEVERHDTEAGGSYPHHDLRVGTPPHGRLNGPDNCLVVGNDLYVVAKDNNLLVRYDLTALVDDPEAGPPPSEVVIGEEIPMADGSTGWFWGHSMLAERDGWLYLGFRTSSAIVRFRLGEPMSAELLALFDPYDPATRRSANLTDMGFGPDGDLYVISAQPSRVYRFTPDPDEVFDARDGGEAPWCDLSAVVGDDRMKSENVLVDPDGRVYVTSGDAYDFQDGAAGAIWRITPR